MPPRGASLGAGATAAGNRASSSAAGNVSGGAGTGARGPTGPQGQARTGPQGAQRNTGGAGPGVRASSVASPRGVRPASSGGGRPSSARPSMGRPMSVFSPKMQSSVAPTGSGTYRAPGQTVSTMSQTGPATVNSQISTQRPALQSQQGGPVKDQSRIPASLVKDQSRIAPTQGPRPNVTQAALSQSAAAAAIRSGVPNPIRMAVDPAAAGRRGLRPGTGFDSNSGRAYGPGSPMATGSIGPARPISNTQPGRAPNPGIIGRGGGQLGAPAPANPMGRAARATGHSRNSDGFFKKPVGRRMMGAGAR